MLMNGKNPEPTEFLSTPSARRATCLSNPRGEETLNFYPRPPRGGRPDLNDGEIYEMEISIHALREEGDDLIVAVNAVKVVFLSTPSARRATCCRWLWVECPLISIHALREEGDSTTTARPATPLYFYPRPPRGGRLGFHMDVDRAAHNFYPRPPRGGRRASAASSPRRSNFYPRPPRGGRLAGAAGCGAVSINFYPRPPRGGRRECNYTRERVQEFLSTPSARRATEQALVQLAENQDFYPRPPRGGRRVPPFYFLLAA